MVVEYLPSLNGRHAAQALEFNLTEEHQRHSGIWGRVIKDKGEWTSIAIKEGFDLVLIGDDLHSPLDDPERPAYLALVTADKRFGSIFYRDELLAALKEHDLKENGIEIVFKESNITLNIEGALYNRDIIQCTPEKLFSYQNGQLCSASLYWKDNEHSLGTIGPKDIVGIGGQASALQDISQICGITLTHPREIALRRRSQYVLKHPECPELSHILAPGHQFNMNGILGWERR
jgi:hypothetical protein